MHYSYLVHASFKQAPNLKAAAMFKVLREIIDDKEREKQQELKVPQYGCQCLSLQGFLDASDVGHRLARVYVLHIGIWV